MPTISFQGVEKYRLDNGLTVLLEVNRSSPVVSLNIGVKIGSIWETGDEAGLSHVLEHMVFKGTQKYGPGEISTLVEASGGELNAYTSFDQTVYYINLSSRHWTTGLHLIKELVYEAIIDPTELSREKEVVLEEIRRGKDQPLRLLSEILFSLAYKTHPYGRPVIGFDKTVRAFTAQKVQEFYNRWYVPNNMVLAICGDFNKDEMRQKIEIEFGPASTRPFEHPELPHEALPNQPRLTQTSRPVQGNYLSMAFPIPRFKHEDTPALDLFSHLLGQGEASRFEQIIKEKKKLVSSIESVAFTPAFPGLFMVDAVVPQKNIQKILPAIFEEIEFARNQFFPVEHLDRARTNMKSSLIYEKETCEGTARKWLVYETMTGDFRYEEKYLKALDQVTVQDLRRVANKYLQLKTCSTALVHPTDQKTKLAYSKTLSPPSKKKGKEKFRLVDEAQGIRKFKLDNGLTILTRENQRLPILSLCLAYPGGLRTEKTINNGVSHLMTDLLEKETTTKNTLKIAEISESIAGHVTGYCGRNSWGLTSSFLSKKMDQGFDLFYDILLHPAFSQKEFKKEQQLTLEAIRNQQDSLSYFVLQKFQETLYPHHPYGMPLLGSAKTVRKLTKNTILNYYKRSLNPNNMVISIVGDFKSEEIVRLMADSLEPLKSCPSKKLKLKKEPLPRNVQKIEIKRNKMQAHIALGFMGTTMASSDRYAFDVLNYVLAGQGGRLFLELRDKQSLAYAVTSMMVEGIEPGFFAVYIGTEPQKVDQAITGILEELRKLQKNCISPEELDRAKNYIVGNHELDRQRNANVASTIAFNELYGFPMEEYEDFSKKILKVTAEEVLGVARKYFKLDAYTLAVIQP